MTKFIILSENFYGQLNQNTPNDTIISNLKTVARSYSFFKAKFYQCINAVIMQL